MSCFILFRVLGSLALGLPLAIIPAIITAFGLVIITLIRYPANLYKTFRVTILTVVLRKRLKFLILISLFIIQLLYPIIGVIVALVGSLVGWCGLCVHWVYSHDENIVTLMEMIPKCLKEYWQAH